MHKRGGRGWVSGCSATHLVKDDKEQAIGQNGPDEDIAEDSGNETCGVGHHDGAVPVDGNKGPGQRARGNGLVDEARVTHMAEVQGRQVDEVDDQHNLSPREVTSDKQHDEGEVEEVVEDEVATDSAGRVLLGNIAGEQMADVAGLQNEQDEPRQSV